MNLYYYQHCPFCIRVFVAAGLLDINLTPKILLNDDEKTPVAMVGRKVVPILEYETGKFMPESLDIVNYLAQLKNTTFAKNDEDIAAVEAFLADIRTPSVAITMPRSTMMNLQEFATQSAIDYFVNKKQAHYGELFSTMLDNTTQHINDYETILKQHQELFDNLAQKPHSIAAIVLFAAIFLATTLDLIDFTPAKNFIEVMQRASKLTSLC